MVLIQVLLVDPGDIGKKPTILATKKTDAYGKVTFTAPEVKYKTKLMIIARTRPEETKATIYVMPARWAT
jgi:hypothetical protein